MTTLKSGFDNTAKITAEEQIFVITLIEFIQPYCIWV